MKSIKFWIGIVISMIFLYLALRKVEIGQMVTAFRGVNWLYLIPTLVLTLLNLLIRAYRWRYLLRPIGIVGISSLFSATTIGLMSNNLLPARLGELVRAYVLGEQTGLNKSASFATIVLERILDIFILLVFLAAILLVSSFPAWVTRMGYTVLLINVGVLGFLMVLKTFPNRVEEIVRSILFFAPSKLSLKVIWLVRSFAEGLQVFSSWRPLLIALALSVVLWLVIAGTMESALLAFGLPLPIAAPFVVLVILSFGLIVPSAPGFVGIFQFFTVAGLELFAVSKDRAFSFSILFHATQFIPITAIGLICLWKLNLSFVRLSKVSSVNGVIDANSGSR